MRPPSFGCPARAWRARVPRPMQPVRTAASIADRLGRPDRDWMRRLLPQRRTFNVVAELGPADAERTVVLIAHHDAAHSGLVFHPAIPRTIGDRFPQVFERIDTSPPLMAPVIGGPALAALGALSG